jgi:Raf kinase inhibitor-like YbhB/YbcL family protein
LRIAVLVAALAVTGSGCSDDSTSPAASSPSGASSPTTPDDGSFAVLPGDGFHADGSFDPRMTCDGAGDYSPPLVFRNVPAGAVELVLSMVDVDKTSSAGDPLIHWVEWRIPPDSGGLTEHVKPDDAREALNDLHESTYDGPCPPGGETHHYRFTLLALSKHLDLAYGTPAREVLAAAKDGTIASSTFTAGYRRTN